MLTTGIFISTSEILKKYPLLEEYSRYFDSNSVMRVYQGDQIWDGDLAMDDYEKWSLDISSGDNAFGMIIDGNLTINGNLINRAIDSGLLLLVNGNLKSKHINKGGSCFIITGNCDIDGVIIGEYPNGTLCVMGETKAQYLFDLNHCIETNLINNNLYQIYFSYSSVR